jgi:hypothetical protein
LNAAQPSEIDFFVFFFASVGFHHFAKMILWASNVRPPTLKMKSHNFIMSLLKSFSNWVRIRMSLYTGMVCAAADGQRLSPCWTTFLSPEKFRFHSIKGKTPV